MKFSINFIQAIEMNNTPTAQILSFGVLELYKIAPKAAFPAILEEFLRIQNNGLPERSCNICWPANPSDPTTTSDPNIGSKSDFCTEPVLQYTILARLRCEINSLAELQENWDTYGAERIKDVVIKEANLFTDYFEKELTRCSDLSNIVAEIGALANGGIEFYLTKNNRYLQVELNPFPATSNILKISHYNSDHEVKVMSPIGVDRFPTLIQWLLTGNE